MSLNLQDITKHSSPLGLQRLLYLMLCNIKNENGRNYKTSQK